MNGRSLLHYAADAGNYDVLKELINNGANVNVKNSNKKKTTSYWNTVSSLE